MKVLLKRILLTVLSMLPIASVALAAESKLLEIEGEMRSDALAPGNPLKLKMRLFAPYSTKTTRDEALAHFARESGISDRELLNSEFEKTVAELQRQGLLKVDEKELVSENPSRWGGF